MSNKSKKKSNVKSAQKKTNFLPIIAAAAVVVCVAVVFLVNGNGTSNEGNGADLGINGVNTVASGEQAENNETNLGNSGAVTIASGESLVIPTADITTDVSFFPLEVDGTAMEVLAVRASDGTVRTAFNTCQSCYTSGRGYYKQEGSDLVCRNCGFHFTPDDVEITSGGCNPWPIFDGDKTVTDDTISISYDFLVKSQNIFANWRVN